MSTPRGTHKYQTIRVNEVDDDDDDDDDDGGGSDYDGGGSIHIHDSVTLEVCDTEQLAVRSLTADADPHLKRSVYNNNYYYWLAFVVAVVSACLAMASGVYCGVTGHCGIGRVSSATANNNIGSPQPSQPGPSQLIHEQARRVSCST